MLKTINDNTSDIDSILFKELVLPFLSFLCQNITLVVVQSFQIHFFITCLNINNNNNFQIDTLKFMWTIEGVQ